MRNARLGLFTVMATLMVAMMTVNINTYAYTLFDRGNTNFTNDQWVLQVGHLSGVGGSLWRADIWLFNPGAPYAGVTIDYYPRGNSNPKCVPFQYIYSLEQGEVVQLPDILEMFGVDGGAGALRFTSDQQVIITGRAYNANAPTLLGPGTSGQQFSATDPSDALVNGEWADLVGVGVTDKFRSNFGFVEVSGSPVTVNAQLLDRAGNVLSKKSYPLGGFGVVQMPLNDLVQTGTGTGLTDNRLHFGVTDGSGKVIGFGSLIDNVTGNPTTINMVLPWPRPGRYSAVGIKADGSLGGAVTFTVAYDDGVLRLKSWEQTYNIACPSLNIQVEGMASFPLDGSSDTTQLTIPPWNSGRSLQESTGQQFSTPDGVIDFGLGAILTFLSNGGIKGFISYGLRGAPFSTGKWAEAAADPKCNGADGSLQYAIVPTWSNK